MSVTVSLDRGRAKPQQLQPEIGQLLATNTSAYDEWLDSLVDMTAQVLGY